MESVARKIEVKAVFQQFGEVVDVAGEEITVRGALADLKARRAASCLLAPAVGDRVLLAAEDDGDAFVLAVLEQRDASATTLAVEGDLHLRSTRGKVTLAAQEGIDLVTTAAVQIASTALDVNAVEAIRVLGGAVKAELGKVRLFASTLDSFAERVSQRVKRSHRVVEEIDQVKAGYIEYAAEGNAHVRGENTLISATDLVKFLAEQIHVG